jgi:hypothetical protein
MLDISWGGLLGAIVGTIVSGLLYGTLIDRIEQFLKARNKASHSPPMSRAEIALMRRAVLAVNILLFAALGYVIGHSIGDYMA